MKIYLRLILFICFSAIALGASAQGDTRVSDLIKQGIELNSQKKYAEAADKYKAALAIEPDNIQANYQMAFTLFSAGKNAEALPFIEKATHGPNPKFTAMAYSLMGSIYQGSNQLPNAVTAYQNAIKADPANQRIYYNLGIAYFKGRFYAEAESSFEAAVKKDSSDAGSWRMYALSTFHQDKRPAALLGFCRFLMLEPNSSRSAEAFGNLQNILSGGKLAPEPGQAKRPTEYILYYNNIVTNALTKTATRKYATPGDLLVAQLRMVFGTLYSMPTDKYYFWFALSGYFGTLATTDNMPAFARYISQSAKPESAKWLKDNPDKLGALQNWIATNRLKFL